MRIGSVCPSNPRKSSVGRATPGEKKDIRSYIRRFMITFGLVSTVFDFLTFGFLLYIARAKEQLFQTGWFVESLITELAIVFVIRTRKAFWKSSPSCLLAWLSLATLVLAIAVSYLPFAGWLGFVPLPPFVLPGLLVITVLYLLASEATKRWLFGREASRAPATT
ncbi:hypothetical protein NIBR502774_17410 (plasmid) [Rhizobium sp. NIBRBAC000502774]|nr:hypothetical protein NIBR502774_17410 [Rhizobium sp. NIBRBAC000502774]